MNIVNAVDPSSRSVQTKSNSYSAVVAANFDENISTTLSIRDNVPIDVITNYNEPFQHDTFMSKQGHAMSNSEVKKSAAVKSASNGRSRIDIGSMESDVAAKARARASRAAGTSVWTNTDEAIAAKIRQGLKSTASSPPTLLSPSSSTHSNATHQSSLMNLDDRISAKLSVSGTRISAKSVLATDPSIESASFHSNENYDDVVMRSPDRVIRVSTKPIVSRASSGTSRVSMQSMESDAAAKSKASSILDDVAAGRVHSRLAANQNMHGVQFEDSDVDHQLESKSYEVQKHGVDVLPYGNDDTELPTYDMSSSIGIKKHEFENENVHDQSQYGKKGAEREDFEYNVSKMGLGLAVAMAVEEEEDKYIPAAVEFDPDSKPPVYKNRRVRLFVCLACIVIVVIILATAVSVSFVNNSADLDENDISPPPYRETIGIKDQIARVIGNDLLDDTNSPYVEALQWITHEDPMMLLPDATNFVQRYVAAYLYFATSQTKPWSSCTKPVGNETEDCIFTKLVGSFPVLATEIPWKRWLGNTSECDWAGIFCNENEQIRAVEICKYPICCYDCVYSGRNLTFKPYSSWDEHDWYLPRRNQVSIISAIDEFSVW
jgi:hypothetical protein